MSVLFDRLMETPFLILNHVRSGIGMDLAVQVRVLTDVLVESINTGCPVNTIGAILE